MKRQQQYCGDLHHIDAYPDPSFYFDGHPDPTTQFFPDVYGTLPMLQNDLLKLPLFHFDADPDTDSAFYFDADADPDPAFQFDADADPDPASYKRSGSGSVTLINRL
jgi:hypothetical protein